MTADPTTDVASKARDGLTYPVINFCTTHRELMLPVSDDTILLEIGERGVVDRSRHPNVLNCFEEAPITRNYRAELAVVSGLLTASRYLRRNNIGDETVANFVTYRLFILPEKTEHHRVPIQMNFVSPEEVSAYAAQISPDVVDAPWLLPRHFPGLQIEKSYAERHGDGFFELFVQSTIDAGVLNAQEAQNMAGNLLHLTAMGVGRMPAGVFCDISDKAEIAIIRFLRDHAGKAHDDARFQLGLFLYERLAIYLMELELRKRFQVIPREIFGIWTMVSAERKWIPGTLEGDDVDK